MARFYNDVFKGIGSGTVDFLGFAIGVSGVKSDKYPGCGTGGVLGNAISDRYLEKITVKPPAVLQSFHAELMAGLGVASDLDAAIVINDLGLGHLSRPHSRTALGLSLT